MMMIIIIIMMMMMTYGGGPEVWAWAGHHAAAAQRVPESLQGE